jgi:isocitrate dehydrogenase
VVGDRRPDCVVAVWYHENEAPSRRLGQIDNRGSHFYLALFWAEELASQAEDPALAAAFAPLAKALRANESTIAAELLAVQGAAVDLGGYYRPDPAKADAVMRPSKTLNEVLSLFRRS